MGNRIDREAVCDFRHGPLSVAQLEELRRKRAQQNHVKTFVDVLACRDRSGFLRNAAQVAPLQKYNFAMYPANGRSRTLAMRVLAARHK
jgi:hypothetical protein